MNDPTIESSQHTDESTSKAASTKFNPLRVWPAIFIAIGIVGLVASRLLTPFFEDDSMILLLSTMLGPAALAVIVLIWWLAFSRATMLERLIGLVGILVFIGLTVVLSDKTMMGPAIMLITLPMGAVAFVAGAYFCRRQLSIRRTVVALLLAACGFGFTTLLRSDGMWGHGELDLYWRWNSSAEEHMLANRKTSKTDSPKITNSEFDAWLAEPQWPRFRGPDGLSQQHGPKIAVDWDKHPPKQIWNKSIGPGWSSFVVAGNLLFTQEQLGENEAVVCYSADAGNEIWSQEIESRFSDPLGGPGPRATPTLSEGRLFVQGANGQLQRLDPKTGAAIWSVDLREIANRKPPTWGFSSSPLVVGSVVVVHAGGSEDKGTLAFDIESGELTWSAAAGDHSYSSPQLCSIDGEDYVVMVTNHGMNILDPESGHSLLDYDWKFEGYRVLQPQVIDGDSILLPTGLGSGTRRLKIAKSENGLTANEMWTSLQLKPDFNDFVVHNNHAYGFDNKIFVCIDLADGSRKWKGGRYGNGQVLLLANSEVLLVTSEDGNVVLLAADPSGRQELTKFKAIEGRTWNHPVVVNDRLYIRNSQYATCYQLPLQQQQVNKTSGSQH